METIGLIAAMPQESDALLRCVRQWKRTAPAPFRGVRFQLMDRECLLVTSGMGLKRAEGGARALLAATSVDLLVSFGIAGAVRDDLQIGDVVVSGKVCLLEKSLPGKFWPLASLSDLAWNAAAQALQPDETRLVAGTAITTRGSQVVLQPPEEIENPVLEMETAAIAQVAVEKGIPLVSIRSISDGPQSPIPFDLEAIIGEEGNLRLGRGLITVLRKPQAIFRSWQMIQNSRKAADCAAKAVTAALSQSSPVISS